MRFHWSNHLWRDRCIPHYWQLSLRGVQSSSNILYPSSIRAEYQSNGEICPSDVSASEPACADDASTRATEAEKAHPSRPYRHCSAHLAAPESWVSSSHSSIIPSSQNLPMTQTVGRAPNLRLPDRFLCLLAQLCHLASIVSSVAYISICQRTYDPGMNDQCAFM